MIPDRLDGLVDLLLPTLQAAVEEVDDARGEPGDTGLDAGDGDLDVVQIAILFRSREVVGAEGAEQQRQKKIQHLWTERCCVTLHLAGTDGDIVHENGQRMAGLHNASACIFLY